jgi:hypothetical protein
MDHGAKRDKEHLVVFVNDRPVTIYRGMTVKHALLALDQALFKAAQDGDCIVRDDQGFVTGLEGALNDGARLSVRKARGNGQKVNGEKGPQVRERQGKTGKKHF